MDANDKTLIKLKNKLETKRWRVSLRYRYYEMKQATVDLSKMVPPSMKWLTECLGWNATAVDSLADRIVFNKFEDDNFDMMGIYNMNNPDVLFDTAVLSAMISSCCFIYISPDKDGFPRLQVIDGGNATGNIDPITGMLTEGYAVLERDKTTGVPLLEAYFTNEHTYYYENGKENDELRVDNVAPYPLLVPIIYRPDAKRPFGHSRISRACMSLTQSALRTLKRSEIAAEFYSFPQKYILGLSEDNEIDDKWEATMSSLITFTKDEDGDKPTVGQFSQQSMQPYSDQLRTFASLFAGETGLTLDDLGFVSDNPSSADAIKASHEKLRLTARKAQRTFGSGFLNAGYLAACVRDDYTYLRNQIYLTKPCWEPIFEPDAAMLLGIGDGAIKINQAVPGYFGADNLRTLTGIDASANQTASASEDWIDEE